MTSLSLGNMQMADLRRLRRMGVEDAKAFIAGFTMTDAERYLAMNLVGKDLKPSDPPSLPRGQIHDSSRAIWFVSAWLMGASWTQLGYLHGIRRQTVMSSADTLMISHLRQQARLRQSMTYEALSAYRAAFLAQPELYELEPTAIAERLLSTTEMDK